MRNLQAHRCHDWLILTGEYAGVQVFAQLVIIRFLPRRDRVHVPTEIPTAYSNYEGIKHDRLPLAIQNHFVRFEMFDAEENYFPSRYERRNVTNPQFLTRRGAGDHILRAKLTRIRPEKVRAIKYIELSGECEPLALLVPDDVEFWGVNINLWVEFGLFRPRAQTSSACTVRQALNHEHGAPTDSTPILEQLPYRVRICEYDHGVVQSEKVSVPIRVGFVVVFGTISEFKIRRHDSTRRTAMLTKIVVSQLRFETKLIPDDVCSKNVEASVQVVATTYYAKNKLLEKHSHNQGGERE